MLLVAGVTVTEGDSVADTDAELLGVGDPDPEAEVEREGDGGVDGDARDEGDLSSR